jgi:hypothetical protein
LSARDQLALVAGGVRMQARLMLPRSFRLRDGAAAVLDVDGYRPPDSAAAREAEELCREASEPFLEQHCHRTHLWGVVIGRHERLDFDAEALYVAALTHDLGLTERFRGHDPDAECFSLDSAAAARDLTRRHDWPEPRADTVVEAIALHLNATVPPSQGAEAYLLQFGAAPDVTGARFDEVDRATRDALLERHPRLDFKREFVATIRADMERHPHARPAFFSKRAGFLRRIEKAPYRE